MPYRPISLFCFLNTNACFHGVEPIVEANVIRDLILYVVRIENPGVPFKGVADYASMAAHNR